VSAPLFIAAFTAIGANRAGYDWRRCPVSSLGLGEEGWPQRTNFAVTGMLFLLGALGLRRCPRRRVGPRAVPALVAAAGVGLIGSGLFVTDPVDGFPSENRAVAGPNSSLPSGPVPTRAGKLHNLFAIPIFAGLPVAAIVSAAGAARRKRFGWAGYSAFSGVAMVTAFVAFGAALAPQSRLAGKGGIFQRISIASGFGWLSVLSLRALSS
jgi:hypothetical protein